MMRAGGRSVEDGEGGLRSNPSDISYLTENLGSEHGPDALQFNQCGAGLLDLALDPTT